MGLSACHGLQHMKRRERNGWMPFCVSGGLGMGSGVERRGKEAFGLRVAPWPDCNQHNIHPPRRRARGLPIHPPPIASKVATAAMVAICLAVAAPVTARDPLILLPSWKCDG